MSERVKSALARIMAQGQSVNFEKLNDRYVAWALRRDAPSTARYDFHAACEMLRRSGLLRGA